MHSLAHLLNGKLAEETAKTTDKPAITKHAAFGIRRRRGMPREGWDNDRQETETILEDAAISLYLKDLANRRDNNGVLSDESVNNTHRAAKVFSAIGVPPGAAVVQDYLD